MNKKETDDSILGYKGCFKLMCQECYYNYKTHYEECKKVQPYQKRKGIE